jgi:cobalamin biosynthesis protein CobD/CbiB
MDAPTGGGTGELGALEWLPQKKSKHMIICKHKIGFDCHHGNPYGLPIWFIIMEMHMLFKWVMQWGDIEVSWKAIWVFFCIAIKDWEEYGIGGSRKTMEGTWEAKRLLLSWKQHAQHGKPRCFC